MSSLSSESACLVISVFNSEYFENDSSIAVLQILAISYDIAFININNIQKNNDYNVEVYQKEEVFYMQLLFVMYNYVIYNIYEYQ